MKELALLFFRLGFTAFGGPAAHIAMMEDEVVKRRGWITHEYFLDMLGATNLIPGPNSTEMAIHIGYVRAGWRGLVLAGVCFIAPAVLITLVIAELYRRFGPIPHFSSVMIGVRGAVIAIILSAVARLGRPMLKQSFMLVTGLIVEILSLVGADEVMLLLVAGAAGLIWNYRAKIRGTFLYIAASIPLLSIGASAQPAETVSGVTLTGLGIFFLKIGSILYGSGYVLVAFLQGGLVDARQWLTQSQLLDAIAAGQFTPGPVLSTATFIGYLILGIPGATVATIGIFLPSFVFVLISGPFIPRIRKSPPASGFLDGVNAAALGLMLAVTITLGMATLGSMMNLLIFIAALAVLVIWNLNPAWIVAGAGCVGWMVARMLQ